MLESVGGWECCREGEGYVEQSRSRDSRSFERLMVCLSKSDASVERSRNGTEGNGFVLCPESPCRDDILIYLCVCSL